MKLYISTNHPRHWIAYDPGRGWLIFPHAENGWEKREPVCGLDPVCLREVPARLAALTGFEPPQVKPARKTRTRLQKVA